MNVTLEIQAIIDANLNAALENHYDDILTWTAEDIALDLLAYADDFAFVATSAELVPYVEIWLKSQKTK